MCLALKLFIKMCIACRYFIVWLQQLSPHLLGCSQRDQAKCCSHISKCDDYSCLVTLDQTWFHLCCKCHFKWLSVCRSPCSPSFHFSNSFLSTIHPCVYNSLPLNSLFSISSVIYLLPASFFQYHTFSKQWITYLLSLYFLPVSLQTFIPFLCFVSPTPFFFHPSWLFLKILNYLWVSASLHLLRFLSLLSFLYLPPSPPLTSLTLFLNLYHFLLSILVCSSNGLRLFSHYKVLEYTIFKRKLWEMQLCKVQAFKVESFWMSLGLWLLHGQMQS